MAAPTQVPGRRHQTTDLPGPCTSVRWRVALCGFTCFLVTQTFRLSFTVGVSCMVGRPVRHHTNNQSGSFQYSPGLDRTWNSTLGGNQSERRYPSKAKNGEFDWTKKTQGLLLSAYFYGYLVSQVPGGWLSRRYGTRWVIGVTMMVAMACTAVTPICARTHVYLLFAVRVLLGAAQGVVYPSLFNLTVRWVPPLEVTRFVAIVVAGFPIGQVLTFPISGLLCQYGFGDGWASIPYVFGQTVVADSAHLCPRLAESAEVADPCSSQGQALVSLVWLAAWFFTVYDTPIQHPRISKAEQQYIVSRAGRLAVNQEKRHATPWRSILTSLPVLGTALGFFGVDWVNNTFGLGLILYLREVLEYEIASSGFLGALPPLVYFLSSMTVGFVSDFIIKKQFLSRVNTRRLFQAISFIPTGIFLSATGFVTKDKAGWAMPFLILAQMFFGFSRGGFIVSVMDFAPRFAGEISGLLNTVAQTTGLLVPVAIGSLTPNGSQEEWRTIFLIGGGIAFIGALGFCMFARGEVQPWAKCEDDTPEVEIMVEVTPPVSKQKT